MAPKKRTSSGGKKPCQQNKDAVRPSKFGIQHFFERQSQSQKDTCPRSSNRGDDIEQKIVFDSAAVTNYVPETVRKQENSGECVEIAPDFRGKTNLEKIESMGTYLRVGSLRSQEENSTIVNGTDDGCENVGRTDVPVAECATVNGENSGTGDVVVVDLKSLRSRRNSRLVQDDTGFQSKSPMVIDVDDDKLEVSPEVSKSSNLKRFKFSPGMLIKMSQDDVADEVTWKISPVNEKLHAMSKNLKGRTRILADSTRFNTMNLQQCSLKKVEISPGTSGNLEKCNSSSPLKADKASLKSSKGFELRQVKQFDEFSGHGICKNVDKCCKSEVKNTQSPFTTPPSLSCCQDKAVQDVDSSGRMDQWGLRHHKKALIELLDQVEDVISIEQSSCSNNSSMLDGQLCPKSGASVGNLEKHDHLRKSISSYLVLEVSEEHGNGEPMHGHSSSKVLRLLDEQSGSELVSHLQDEWYFSTVAPGDTVHLIGEFDGQGKCDVNHHKNFVIVHPDILVSGTRVSASFSCPRRTVLDMRLKHGEYSAPALMGTLLHQIFQAGLISESPTKEFLEDYARMACLKSLESLFACGVNENDILKTLIESIPKILQWITSFRGPQKTCPSIAFKSGEEELKNIKISEVIDIEEMVWAPKYGLKGMIDASVQVVTRENPAEACERIMPLEFKTGKGTSGPTALEHNAQVVLYTLLMSERYMTNIDHGLLYYLHTDQTHGISVKRSDLVGLIMRRNELANDLLKASMTQQLPPMLQTPSMCRSCRQLSVCSIYHKSQGGSTEGSGLGDVYESFVPHLTTVHTAFLRKWERFVDLETKHTEVVKKGSWFSDTSRNDEHPSYLSSMILDTSDQAANGYCRGNRFVYQFVRSEHSLLDKEQKTDKNSTSSSSFLECMFKIGDYVILSTDSNHVQIANGIIADIGDSYVSVSFGRKLKLSMIYSGSTESDLHKQSWRIDRDEVLTMFAIMRYNLVQLLFPDERSSRLRNMVVDLEMPKFDSGCSFTQDPALSYVSSEKSLNDDQRRAILKILTAKNYALILGMPGTGKTSMLVYAVKALLMKGSSILLTSYTNSAVDNLLIKLKAQGIDFVRIGRYEAVHEEIREKCLSATEMTSTQEIKERLDGVKIVAVTCLGITSPLLTNKRFDVCIMDEAGQITLPVSLGPLMLASKFVLVGDHYQLPPLVQSPEAKENGMSVSLFSRLSEAHPHAIAALHFQYRMCEDIMELSNALIYGNRLQCGSVEVANAKLKYKHSASIPAWLVEVLNPDLPVTFINTDLVPAYERNGQKAINNPAEVFIIAEVTKSLLLRGIEEKDIGIITPYNSQANLIRESVPATVETHTIDKYQGRDKDCILLSFVRSSENIRNNASLLGDWHRINVALTRAKKKLIMVGSCRSLSRVPLLKLLINKMEELSGMLAVTNKDINYQPQSHLKRCLQSQ